MWIWYKYDIYKLKKLNLVFFNLCYDNFIIIIYSIIINIKFLLLFKYNFNNNAKYKKVNNIIENFIFNNNAKYKKVNIIIEIMNENILFFIFNYIKFYHYFRFINYLLMFFCLSIILFLFYKVLWIILFFCILIYLLIQYILILLYYLILNNIYNRIIYIVNTLFLQLEIANIKYFLIMYTPKNFKVNFIGLWIIKNIQKLVLIDIFNKKSISLFWQRVIYIQILSHMNWYNLNYIFYSKYDLKICWKIIILFINNHNNILFINNNIVKYLYLRYIEKKINKYKKLYLKNY